MPLTRFDLTLPGLPAMVPVARWFTRGVVEYLGDDESLVHAAELAVSEIFSDALSRTPPGLDGVITLRAVASRDGIRITIADRGTAQHATPAELEPTLSDVVLSTVAPRMQHTVSPTGAHSLMIYVPMRPKTTP
ncbi:ATP-binding protein [Microtetraspora malaysiensis]|uniref:ATP-binding protein n=1 Tax=Microtetraspora malaysiensis TaxID=161358 RepID=A0ABW6T347_9ACTN